MIFGLPKTPVKEPCANDDVENRDMPVRPWCIAKQRPLFCFLCHPKIKTSGVLNTAGQPGHDPNFLESAFNKKKGHPRRQPFHSI